MTKPFSIKILQDTISLLTSSNSIMTAIAIKKTLNEIDNKTFSLVQNKLSEYYHCNLSDCFETPEYLSRILKEIYGKSYSTILESIKKNLDSLVEDVDVSKFLLELDK